MLAIRHREMLNVPKFTISILVTLPKLTSELSGAVRPVGVSAQPAGADGRAVEVLGAWIPVFAGMTIVGHLWRSLR